MSAAQGGSILEKIQQDAGIPLPTWAIGTLSALVLFAGVVAVLKPLWPFAATAVKSVRNWCGRRNQDQRRAERRSRFADYIEGQIRRLGEKEEWRDNRYAELEAEVEVREEGRRRWLLRSRLEVRRLPSLSKALEALPHRLVLLEGDPGSGKSVALRHLTQLMCLRLVRRPSEKDPIPLYVNLKDFRPPGPAVSAADVREFVLASVNRGRNRDIDRYMDEEFDRGVEEGAWLFLFDSFDEIPAILSATEANETIERYSDALYDFLHGMGACRGVVASREFRGPPRRYNWPKFTIVPLTWTRKIELIEKADLDVTVEQSLIDDLQEAPAELRGLSDNPMFLGLLCEHVRDGNTFPETAHVVTESYVSERFSRDADRIRDIFAVEPELVREIAEELAFRIASEAALGLTVERRAVVPLLAAHLNHSEEEVHAGLDALEYTKLARSSEDGAGASITFSHRRIQEYFATRVVLRDATRVDTLSLVLDGRWREAAVTVLQVQGESQVRDVLAVIAANLVVPDEPFSWQAHQFHLLEILADGGGYAKYPDGLEQLSCTVDAILVAAWESGTRRNKRWALEVCSAASPALALRFIREAFEGDSEWLREEAYSQARRVRQVTAEIEREIRQMLLDFSISGEVRRSYRSIRAQLCRIANPADLLHAVNLLRLAPLVDCVPLMVIVAVVAYHDSLGGGLILGLITLPVWFWPRVMFARPEGNRARWLRVVRRLFGTENKSLPRPPIIRTLTSAPVAFLLVIFRAVPVASASIMLELVLGRNIVFVVIYLVLLGMGSGIWLIGALLAVRSGRWLRPVHWLFLVVLPVVQLARTVCAATGADLWRWSRNMVVTVLAVGSYVWGMSMLPSPAESGPFSEIGGIAILSVMAGGMLVGLIGQRVLYYRDRRKAELAGTESMVDAPWLADRFASMRRSDAIVFLLRNLQKASPKPLWATDALVLLGSIGRQAELYRAMNRARRKCAEKAFAELWQPYGIGKHPELDKFATSEVLDEIGKVEDDSRVNR